MSCYASHLDQEKYFEINKITLTACGHRRTYRSLFYRRHDKSLFGCYGTNRTMFTVASLIAVKHCVIYENEYLYTFIKASVFTLTENQANFETLPGKRTSEDMENITWFQFRKIINFNILLHIPHHSFFGQRKKTENGNI